MLRRKFFHGDSEPPHPRKRNSTRQTKSIYLPPELWLVIISFIPLRARLLILSLVSKRFLWLSRKSITSLPRLCSLSAYQSAQAMLLTTDGYTRLTSIESLYPGITPPTSLLHLSIEFDSVQPPLLLTSLTSLSLDTSNVNTAVSLLEQNSYSLKRLSFRYKTYSSTFLNKCLEVRLTALTSLSLHMGSSSLLPFHPIFGYDLSSAISAWVSAYALQLHELTLLGDPSIIKFPFNSIYQFRMLRLLVLGSSDVATTITQAIAVLCVAYAPRIESISLSVRSWDLIRQPNITSHLAPFLVELFVGSSPLMRSPYQPAKMLMECISRECVRLRHLQVTSTQCFDMLWGCTFLTKLTLLSLPRSGAKMFRLPNLRELDVTIALSWQECFIQLEKILVTHPRLTSINATIRTSHGDVAWLQSFLCIAEERHVESIVLDMKPFPDLNSPIRQVARSFKWLEVTVMKGLVPG